MPKNIELGAITILFKVDYAESIYCSNLKNKCNLFCDNSFCFW